MGLNMHDLYTFSIEKSLMINIHLGSWESYLI